MTPVGTAGGRALIHTELRGLNCGDVPQHRCCPGIYELIQGSEMNVACGIACPKLTPRDRRLL